MEPIAIDIHPRWPGMAIVSTIVARGEQWREAACAPDALNWREREVLLIVYRQTDQEFAERLDISRRTNSRHLARILQKPADRNRREAVAAFSAGIAS